MTNHSGFGGWVTINGTQFPLKTWRLSDATELAKFKNSMTGNRPVYEGMYIEGQVTLSLAHDFDNDIFGAPANVFPGAQLTNLKLGLHQTNRVTQTLDGVFHSASNFVVERIEETVSTTDGQEIPDTITGYIYGTVEYA